MTSESGRRHEASSRKVVYAALAGNLLIALSKFIAAYFTGSSSILSEGIHSLVDTGDQLLLLYGMHRAKEPADREFPFGHGKEIYFWSLIVAILIFALGAGVSLYEGIIHILNPSGIRGFYINYAILGIAVLFESGSWLVSFREFSKSKGKRGYWRAVLVSKDPTIFIVLFEDSAALLGLAAAFAGNLLTQLTGNHSLDGVASIVIGVILAGTAVFLAHETKGLLIGESAGPEVTEGIRRIAAGCDSVEHVNEVLTMHMGPDFILANVSVDFEDKASADGIEKSVEEIDTRIKKAFPRVKKIFIEAEARRKKAA